MLIKKRTGNLYIFFTQKIEYFGCVDYVSLNFSVNIGKPWIGLWRANQNPSILMNKADKGFMKPLFLPLAQRMNFRRIFVTEVINFYENIGIVLKPRHETCCFHCKNIIFPDESNFMHNRANVSFLTFWKNRKEYITWQVSNRYMWHLKKTQIVKLCPHSSDWLFVHIDNWGFLETK